MSPPASTMPVFIDQNSHTMKTCTRCDTPKPFTEFNYKHRASDIRHSYYRDCGKESTRNHYRRNKQAYLDRNSRTCISNRELIRQVKARPCADCGIQYPYYVMDFDHRDAEDKSFIISDVFRATRTSLLREIEKCDVVCANCHRKRTYKRLMLLHPATPSVDERGSE